VALERCAGVLNGLVGVQYYDVSDPARPLLLGFYNGLTRTAPRDVSLVQRPDGRVFALEANQGDGIRMVDAAASTSRA
jgi:hypothetical protein